MTDLPGLVEKVWREAKEAHSYDCYCTVGNQRLGDGYETPECLALRARIKAALREMVEAWPCPDTACMSADMCDVRSAALEMLQ